MGIKRAITNNIKRLFGIRNLSLFVRKRRQNLEKLFYRHKFTANELIEQLRELGIKPGSVVIVHCAMNNFYNYRGSVDELIDGLLNLIGPEGTLCMPAFPADKDNKDKIFDVRTEKTAAGLLAETFRRRPGVKRSLNKLHSVCALGPQADEIVGEHHMSETCFDEHSPFYKIAQLGGFSIALGLPKYFIGTVGHVPESLLFNKMQYYKQKFTTPVTFTYIDENGQELHHTMWTKSAVPYIRKHSTKIIDENFDKTKYSRTRFSNIWINIFDVNYLVDTLYKLAWEGKTIYSSPKFRR